MDAPLVLIPRALPRKGLVAVGKGAREAHPRHVHVHVLDEMTAFRAEAFAVRRRRRPLAGEGVGFADALRGVGRRDAPRVAVLCVQVKLGDRRELLVAVVPAARENGLHSAGAGKIWKSVEETRRRR